ncbi:MAG: hypothetical protein AAF004_14600, partial [Pseudomonadota bacterium]
QDIANMFIDRGAVKIVNHAPELLDALQSLFANEAARQQMIDRASALMDENRGAVQRLLQQLEPLIKP